MTPEEAQRLTAIVGALAAIVASVSALAGHTIGAARGRATLGAWLGLLLGPVGILVLLFIGSPGEARSDYTHGPPPDDRPREATAPREARVRACPHCGREMPHDATRCVHCMNASRA